MPNNCFKGVNLIVVNLMSSVYAIKTTSQRRSPPCEFFLKLRYLVSTYKTNTDVFYMKTEKVIYYNLRLRYHTLSLEWYRVHRNAVKSTNAVHTLRYYNSPIKTKTQNRPTLNDIYNWKINDNGYKSSIIQLKIGTSESIVQFKCSEAYSTNYCSCRKTDSIATLE